MYEHRRHPGKDSRRQRSRAISSRPDRVALWAVFMAVIVLVVAAASSLAAGGGLGDPDAHGGRCDHDRFGARTLSRGDCGADVKTLNWILNSDRVARRAPLGRSFAGRTEAGVESFQRKHDLTRTGIVGPRTRKALAGAMKESVATWYGPGFFGSETACGRRLTRKTIGVAHRRLPCGTRVTIKYGGRYLRAKVIDRGPYARKAGWDLTAAAAEQLVFTATDSILVAVAR